MEAESSTPQVELAATPTSDPAIAGSRRRRAPKAVEVTWAETVGLGGLVQFLLLIALVIWLYRDQAYRMFVYWQNPDWSHGFLIPFFCLYMANMRKREILAEPAKGSWMGLAVVLGSIGIYVSSIYLRFGYPQALSIVTLIIGLVLFLGGWRILRLTLFPIAFLLLAIPPPERLYRAFTQPLQQGAAKVAMLLLNLITPGEVEQDGINLAYYMPGGRSGMFTVAGACSGMRSLMAFVALGLAMAYFTPRPAWQRVAMAVLVVPVALFCNVVRVVITGGFQMYQQGDLASGTPHTVLGLLMFALGFILYLGVLWVLDHLFVEEKAPASEVA